MQTTVATAASGAPAVGYFDLYNQLVSENGFRKLNLVCIGAHPDDPETGCGGTLARFAAEGHNVHIVYLTRGEAGIRGEVWDKAARTRTSEALAACEVLHTGGHFANQVDSRTRADDQSCREFSELLLSLQPDIVFTHWPFDTHADHRTAAQLAYHAWQWSGERFALVYYEVMTGVQTHNFQPNSFVNIAGTAGQKRSAIYQHHSQQPDRFYPLSRRNGKAARL